jgi:hypothetical protein
MSGEGVHSPPGITMVANTLAWEERYIIIDVRADTIGIHSGYLETDRPKPVLKNFNKKVVKPKVSFSILPTNIPIPCHRQDTAQF